MADRVLRGSRMGHVSYESDRNHDLAPRRVAVYRCADGNEFEVTFSQDADIPSTWTNKSGAEGQLVDGNTENEEEKTVKPPRTHWDMLLERRSIPELEELLKEKLDNLHSRRKR